MNELTSTPEPFIADYMGRINTNREISREQLSRIVDELKAYAKNYEAPKITARSIKPPIADPGVGGSNVIYNQNMQFNIPIVHEGGDYIVRTIKSRSVGSNN